MKSLEEIAQALQGFDPQALSVNKAQEFIHHLVKAQSPITKEDLPLMQALGRIVAEDTISPINVPAHDNSAMDGFAFDGKQLGAAPLQLRVVGTALAGKAWQGSVKLGECVKIMTGAVMPAGLDTVIAQELATVYSSGDETVIEVPAGILQAGDNRRKAGEDLQQGLPALRAGSTLTPAALGLIASLGIAKVKVYRQLRVAYFSTGDEVLSLGDAMREGAVYDSNRYTVFGLLSRMGCQVIDMGVVRDDPVLLEQAFREASEKADVIITSGGVSVGEADFTKQIMQELGDVGFWKIAMRPGRPMAFGILKPIPGTSSARKTLFFGLPGNPVAVMVTFYQFVRSALLQLNGASQTEPPLVQAVTETAIRKKPGRTEFQRAILGRNAEGKPSVRLTGSQGAGILRSMSEANCFVILGHDQGNIAAGDWVDIALFDGLL